MCEAVIADLVRPLFELAFFAGALGAVTWGLVRNLVCMVGDAVQDWEERQLRIRAARARALARSAGD